MFQNVDLRNQNVTIEDIMKLTNCSITLYFKQYITLDKINYLDEDGNLVYPFRKETRDRFITVYLDDGKGALAKLV